jgi:hypothetical protein
MVQMRAEEYLPLRLLFGDCRRADCSKPPLLLEREAGVTAVTEFPLLEDQLFLPFRNIVLYCL